MNEVKAGAGGCYAPQKWTMNGWSATELFCLLILLCFWRLICFHRWVIPSKFHSKSHRIHVCYICGNIYNQCTPNVNIYTSTMDPIGKATNKLPRIRQTHTHTCHLRWRSIGTVTAPDTSVTWILVCLPVETLVVTRIYLYIYVYYIHIMWLKHVKTIMNYPIFGCRMM